MLNIAALFQFRSPLLSESLLISSPAGTEMFHFPAFALYKYSDVYRYTPGCPIRKSPLQSFLAALRGLSQPSTSFIASISQGIHRSLFTTYCFLWLILTLFLNALQLKKIYFILSYIHNQTNTTSIK